MYRVVMYVAALVALVASAAEAEEFACPDGAKDSGYQTGYIVRWCEVGPMEHPLYHGPVWRWHRNGQVAAKEKYINGDATGEWFTWHENGKPAAVGMFESGMKMGAWKYFHTDGSLKTEVSYTATRNRRVDYDLNGKKRSEGYFHQGGKLGLWVYLDVDGAEKARCDFGDGKLTISSPACKSIATELEPKGFSRPIARAAMLTADRVSIVIGDERYALSIPRGWKPDLVSAEKEKLALVVTREVAVWRDDGPNIYFRTLFLEGQSFAKTVDTTMGEIEETVPDFKLVSKGKSGTSAGRSIATRSIRYKGSFSTDSPFTVVTGNAVHELVGFIDVSRSLTFMVVMTASTPESLQNANGAFIKMLRSIEMVKAGR